MCRRSGGRRNSTSRSRAARENNLKNITAKFPIGLLTVVTGVSGSGKSTLVYETLYKGMMQIINKSREQAGKHEKIVFDAEIDKVIVIDQSPIGKTPRSNPATYTKVFDEIRTVFAGTKEAKMRGYKPGRFSFNIRGGRCEACEGDGLIKIEMNFLPDVYIECEECKGKRYNRETLEVLYKGKSIADVLDMSVEEAMKHFENIPSIRHETRDPLPGRPRLYQARPELDHPLGRRGPADQAHPGTCEAGNRQDPLPPGRAHDRAPLRRHEETDQGARRPRGEGQHRDRDRAQPRCGQVRRPPHRYRAGGRGCRRRDRRNRDTGEGCRGEDKPYRRVL